MNRDWLKTNNLSSDTGPRALVFLSLGSNLGDRRAHLAAARDMIAAEPRTRVLAESKILENRAVLFENQPDFLNQILVIATGMEPPALLAFLKATESRIGRVPSFRWGPRAIDLDILTYDSLVSADPDLTLPHPGLRDRPYLATLLRDLGESPASITGGEP